MDGWIKAGLPELANAFLDGEYATEDRLHEALIRTPLGHSMGAFRPWRRR